MTFGWLLDKVEDIRRPNWKKNTERINKLYFSVLRKRFGNLTVTEFADVCIQDELRSWLNDLANRGLSKGYIQHVLIYMRAALNEAVKRKLLHFNYAIEIKVPSAVRAVDGTFILSEDVARLIAYFRVRGQRRNALIIGLLYLCALRPGELFALRWNDWDESIPHVLRINEAFGKSGLDTPKTRQSDSVVYLPPNLQQELREWKNWCDDVSLDAWIFSSKRRTPIKYDNFRRRILQPAAKELGIGHLTHQVLRRAFSTAAVDSGASVKDVQQQMRHTQATMTLHYAKAIPRSVAEEVDKLSRDLLTRLDEISCRSENAPKMPQKPQRFTRLSD